MRTLTFFPFLIIDVSICVGRVPSPLLVLILLSFLLLFVYHCRESSAPKFFLFSSLRLPFAWVCMCECHSLPPPLMQQYWSPPNFQGVTDSKLAEGKEDDNFLKSTYLGMGVGFTVGFWGVCGSLFLIRAFPMF